MSLRYEWDDDKARANLKQHKVGFATIFSDDDHSLDEIREIIIGYSVRNRLVLVSFTERGPDSLRIISARVATRNERKSHEESKEN
jgi:uncharacterized DUF497 family protein